MKYIPGTLVYTYFKRNHVFYKNYELRMIHILRTTFTKGVKSYTPPDMFIGSLCKITFLHNHVIFYHHTPFNYYTHTVQIFVFFTKNQRKLQTNISQRDVVDQQLNNKSYVVNLHLEINLYQ